MTAPGILDNQFSLFSTISTPNYGHQFPFNGFITPSSNLIPLTPNNISPFAIAGSMHNGSYAPSPSCTVGNGLHTPQHSCDYSQTALMNLSNPISFFPPNDKDYNFQLLPNSNNNNNGTPNSISANNNQSNLSSSSSSCSQSNISTALPFNGSEPIISLKILMTGREVGSIIGKRGDNIKKIREESSARINISDGSNPERIVTITGNCDQVSMAGDLISKKIESDFFSRPNEAVAGGTLVNNGDVKPTYPLPAPHIVPTSSTEYQPTNFESLIATTTQNYLTIRLLLPTAHYLCILGDVVGSRLKHLREITRTTIMIGADIYSNSMEKLLTITGPSSCVSHCISEITRILLEVQDTSQLVSVSPKAFNINNGLQTPNGQLFASLFGENMPYSAGGFSILPLPNMLSASIYPDNLAFSNNPHSAPPLSLPLIPLKLPANMQIPTTNCYAEQPLSISVSSQPIPPSNLTNLTPLQSQFSPMFNQSPIITNNSNNNNNVNTKGNYTNLPNNNTNNAPINNNTGPMITREFFLYNDMIGCIIGRGGATINEIRSVSGAQIKIANCEDGKSQRRISITGTIESVHMAQLLINSSIETFKQSVQLKSKQSNNFQAPVFYSSPYLPLLTPNTMTLSVPEVSQSDLSLTNKNISPIQRSIKKENIDNSVPDLYLSCHGAKADSVSMAAVDGNCDNKFDKSGFKMKSTEINLDGTVRTSSNLKYKPY